MARAWRSAGKQEVFNKRGVLRGHEKRWFRGEPGPAWVGVLSLKRCRGAPVPLLPSPGNTEKVILITAAWIYDHFVS